MEILSLSHVRANFEAVLDRVVDDCVPIAVKPHRGEGVVLISQSEWDSIQETLASAGERRIRDD